MTKGLVMIRFGSSRNGLGTLFFSRIIGGMPHSMLRPALGQCSYFSTATVVCEIRSLQVMRKNRMRPVTLSLGYCNIILPSRARTRMCMLYVLGSRAKNNTAWLVAALTLTIETCAFVLELQENQIMGKTTKSRSVLSVVA